MRVTFLLFCAAPAFLSARPAASQIAAPMATATAALPPTRILHFDAKGQQVATGEVADHREEMLYRDSVGGNIRIDYPSGKLRRLVSYTHFRYGIKYGAETSFYETGEIKSRCEFNLVGPIGYYSQFYRSGKLRSRIPLGNDLPKNTKGEAFGLDGQPQEFSPLVEKMPTLGGGGNDVIVAAVQRAVRYPMEALRAQKIGKVLVSFMVDEVGFVQNIRIVKTPSPLFNQAVLAAVASLGRMNPGEQGGEPVDVFYTVPITFAIR